MNKSNKQITNAAFISYAILIINLIINIIFMPWMTRELGKDNYSIYTIANSVASIFILDLGLGATSSKYLAKYRVEGDKEGERNFIGLITKLYLIIDCAIFAIAVIMFLFLDKIYKAIPDNLFNSFENVFVCVAIYSIISLPLTTTNGILTAYEKFVFIKLSSLIHKIVQIALLFVCVFLKLNIFIIVLVNLLTNLLASIIKYIYCRYKLKIKANFKFFDKKMLLGIFAFSIWILMITTSQKLTSSLMPTVLGIVSNYDAIATFGVALLIAEYGSLFSTVLSGMFLPRITKLRSEKDSELKLDILFTRVGRLQSLVIMLIISGFILFGKPFITHLYGVDYIDSYLCGIFLLIPFFISTPKFTMESDSYVKNTVKFSAIIKLICCIIILGVSFLTGYLFGSVGICITIGIGQLVQNIIVDFFVYAKKQNIKMLKFYWKVHFKNIILTLPPFVVFFILQTIFPITTIIQFALYVFLYIVTYAVFNAFIFDKKNYKLLLKNKFISRLYCSIIYKLRNKISRENTFSKSINISNLKNIDFHLSTGLIISFEYNEKEFYFRPCFQSKSDLKNSLLKWINFFVTYNDKIKEQNKKQINEIFSNDFAKHENLDKLNNINENYNNHFFEMCSKTFNDFEIFGLPSFKKQLAGGEEVKLLQLVKWVYNKCKQSQILPKNTFDIGDANKQIATYSFSKLLNLNSIPKCEMTCINTQDNQLIGLIQEKAGSGISPAFIKKEKRLSVTSNFVNELTNLEYFDFICYQLDHRLDNYNIVYKNDLIDGVSVFDNDAPKTFCASLRIPSSTYDGVEPIIKNGILNRNFMSSEFYDSINKIKKSDLRPLKKYLNKFQYFALKSRLFKFKKIVNKTIKKSRLTISNDCNITSLINTKQKNYIYQYVYDESLLNRIEKYGG